MTKPDPIEALVCANPRCGLAKPGPSGLCVKCEREEENRDRGAVEALYRRPRVVGNEHHWLEIEVNGKTRYQRSPPVHVPGSAPRPDDAGHLAPLEISEAEAERRHAEQARADSALADRTPKQQAALRLRANGKSYAAIAGELGLPSVHAVRELLRRARGGLRRQRGRRP